MDDMYYRTIKQIEEAGADPDYVQGWASGYLGNPKREQQHLTAAYESGYTDGSHQVTTAAKEYQ